jgi:hypothetical protein
LGKVDRGMKGGYDLKESRGTDARERWMASAIRGQQQGTTQKGNRERRDLFSL